MTRNKKSARPHHTVKAMKREYTIIIHETEEFVK